MDKSPVLFGEVGLPERLYVDAESALLQLHKDVVGLSMLGSLKAPNGGCYV